MRFHRYPAIILGLACLIPAGCGGGATPSASSSGDTATVTGTVTVQGKPATKGQVSFDPRNINRKDVPTQTVAIRPDGTYEVQTLVGRNSITVIGLAQPGKAAGGLVTEFGLDVQPGTNSFDIPVDRASP